MAIRLGHVRERILIIKTAATLLATPAVQFELLKSPLVVPEVYVIDSSDRRRLEESSAELRELLAEDKLGGTPMPGAQQGVPYGRRADRHVLL